MTESSALTLGKSERLSSRTLINNLFNGSGSRSIAVFPLRVVYIQTERKDNEPPAQMLISVPKKHFKRAVKRNRIKRQVREAYRHNKYLLPDKPGIQLVIAFIWIDNALYDSDKVAGRVRKLLSRIAEKV